MRGKSAFLIGIIAGIVIGNTRQGRAAFRSVGERVSGAWGDSRVQERVGDLQTRLKDVPVVGDDLADVIEKAKPAKPAAAAKDPLGGIGAANLG